MAAQVELTSRGTTVLPLELASGEKILVEATFVPHVEEFDEAFGEPKIPSMDKIVAATESIGADLIGVLKKLEPSKGSVELGFQVSGSAGIPMLTQGTAQANITVTLEWDKAGASA
jgi:hypothetical protein